MNNEKLQQIINKIFESISVQIPTYKSSAIDWTISEGNVAACIIDDGGNIYGKIWGN
jgi:hypothetical protein